MSRSRGKTSGEGPGWHRDSRRHREAALKGKGYRGRVIQVHEAHYPKPSCTPIYNEQGGQIGAGVYTPPPTENEVRAYARHLDKSVNWDSLRIELDRESPVEQVNGSVMKSVDIGFAGLPDVNQDAYVKAMKGVYRNHGFDVIEGEGGYGYVVAESDFPGDD